MEKIWLKNYPKGIPATINADAYLSVVEMFEQSCKKYAAKTAYLNLGSTLSYDELEKKSRAFAGFLQNVLHCQPGDKVAIMLPNCMQYPICFFGALRAGCVVVNVNPLYTPRELLHQLFDSEATAIVTISNFAHTVEQVLSQSKLKHVVVTEIGDVFSPIKRWLANFINKRIKKAVATWNIPSAYAFIDSLKSSHALSFKPVCVRGDDLAILQYTGGTTGFAKGAMLTHRNLIANLEQVSAWVQPIFNENEIVVTALPLYHIFSLLANCLLFLKVGGKNILITNPRNMKNFINEIKKEKFTALTGVNTLFNALINSAEFAKLNLSHFKLSLGGGMAVQKAVAEKWEQLTGHPLLEAYGLTETSPAVAINPLNLAHYNGSIGLPIPSTEISIRDENGNELPIGQEGELCVRGPQVMRGYWKKPEETQKVFFSDGYLRTGDVACMDAQGFLYLKERKKDMIIVSGFNVYPNEVENVIAAHPGVLEVAVIGMPFPATGEMVKAFIVKKDPTLTKEQVLSFCREQLTGYKLPREVCFVEALPKSNVGKILRRELKSLGSGDTSLG